MKKNAKRTLTAKGVGAKPTWVTVWQILAPSNVYASASSVPLATPVASMATTSAV